MCGQEKDAHGAIGAEEPRALRGELLLESGRRRLVCAAERSTTANAATEIVMSRTGIHPTRSLVVDRAPQPAYGVSRTKTITRPTMRKQWNSAPPTREKDCRRRCQWQRRRQSGQAIRTRPGGGWLALDGFASAQARPAQIRSENGGHAAAVAGASVPPIFLCRVLCARWALQSLARAPFGKTNLIIVACPESS